VLRDLLLQGCRDLGITVHDTGTLVVIQGPRFSTRSESRWFTSMGWEVIGMTGYPECHLARELELCYANVSLITDYDVGLEGMAGVAPVTSDQVVKAFNENNARVRELLFRVIPRIPAEPDPHCANALEGARL
jgi:5'-methylthioadenosine phosphorylase